MRTNQELSSDAHLASDSQGEITPTFLDALRSRKVVSGLTHNFYLYPARFSPDFVREVISTFSDSGDLVVDPFMGGGTVAVEALASGRRFLGADINQLAHFVSNVKTTLLTHKDEASLFGWMGALPFAIDLVQEEEDDPSAERYQKHIPWRVRRVINRALESLAVLTNERQRNFARCSILRTAQWALDCRSHAPSKREFLNKHHDILIHMLLGHQEFSEQVSQHFGSAQSLHCQFPLNTDPLFSSKSDPLGWSN